ncbi:MAG TPA: hypothetical protein VG992_04265 [Candidatus Saccharimonadales bacterium]|nr:hypothetical protein [Candidatus Saccharimonadales bacterium]
MKLSSKGFSAVESLLVLIIILLISFIGYYVWHTNQTVDKVNKQAVSELHPTVTKRPACSGSNYQGVTYAAPHNWYSFCVPNGWKVYYNNGQTGSSVISEPADMIYRAKVKPFIAATGGKDGAFPFGVFYNDNDSDGNSSGRLAGYTATGTVQAQGVTGTAYYHLTGVNDSVGAGLADLTPGTKQYVYDFHKGKADLGIQYLIEPGDKDQTALIQALVQTVKM